MIGSRAGAVIGAVALGLGLAAALAGCTPTTPGPTPAPSGSFVDADGVVAEYRATIRTFPLDLPSGESFPADPPQGLLDGRSQHGVGEGAAYFYWLCAWEGDYLTAQRSGDAAGTATALGALAKWPATSYVMTYVSDPGQAWRATVLEPAQRGDPSGVEGDVDGNGCENFGIDASGPS